MHVMRVVKSLAVMANVSRRNVCESDDNGEFLKEAETSSLRES
jgi:hypothetical protein